MIYQGDLFDVLPTLDAESIDACVTDPPYGLGFMAKEWDVPGGIGAFPMRRRVETDAVNTGASRQGGRQRSCEDFQKRQKRDAQAFEAEAERWAAEVFRVLKPGAHLVSFGGTRMFHRMASGIEDAGFEIRDCLSWLYGQGFPKSLNVGDGRGTALKPSWEPIILARKPTVGTVKANVEKHGTGALNIDACRLETNPRKTGTSASSDCPTGSGYSIVGSSKKRQAEYDLETAGRWPANVLLDEEAAALLDEQTGELGASRFYYVAKPSREERDFGCGDLPRVSAAVITGRKEGSAGLQNPRAGVRAGSMDRDTLERAARNVHPTVKPVELMRWLVKLVTPHDGIVLDPFMGSGTTGMACRYEHRRFIGIEREAEYIQIAEARIAAVAPLFGESA